MTQLTQNSGQGYSRAFNPADFARTFLGVPAAQRTQNSGLGFSRAYNDADFARTPGASGGDSTAVAFTLSGIVVGYISDIDGIDMIVEAAGIVRGTIATDFEFSVDRSDVDDIDLPLMDTGLIEFTWA